MSNLRLTGFLILGLALSMGIILWSMHEHQWAYTLFALAALQAIIIALNWNKERKRKHFRK
ncbi:MAG: hypothetical protein IJT19_03345 [Bacteroidaceae bacterium]|jgi:hypothetical protein|nr:hypothetical protein [Bacteroidaceae bacterium]